MSALWPNCLLLERAARLSALLLVFAMSACAVVAPPKEGDVRGGIWEARQLRLAALERWRLQGRVGIETSQDSGSATLTWEQEGEDYAMRIMAPLAQGTFELKGDPGSVTLRGPDNQTTTAADPQALMQEKLGWSLPVAGLKYWVRGIPAPGRPVKQIRIDAAGRMLDLQQDGWRISISRYAQVGTEELPDKLYMENQPLKMRVVIGAWQLR